MSADRCSCPHPTTCEYCSRMYPCRCEHCPYRAKPADNEGLARARDYMAERRRSRERGAL